MPGIRTIKFYFLLVVEFKDPRSVSLDQNQSVKGPERAPSAGSRGGYIPCFQWLLAFLGCG